MTTETKTKPTTAQARKRLLRDAGFVAARLAAGVAIFPFVVALFIANRTLGMIAEASRYTAEMAHAAFDRVGQIVERYKTATADDDLLEEVAEAEELVPAYRQQIERLEAEKEELEAANARCRERIARHIKELDEFAVAAEMADFARLSALAEKHKKACPF